MTLPFYSIRAQICLGQHGNICHLACPEQAVVTAPTAITSEILAKNALAAGDLTGCSQCQTLIAHGPELPSTCFVCRPRPKPLDLFIVCS